MKFLFLSSLMLACAPLVVAQVQLPDLSATELQQRQHFAAYPEGQSLYQLVDELSAKLQQASDDWYQRGEAFMQPLPTIAAQPLPPEPAASNDTIVDSSQGLYFDSQNSVMSYFGQVRLRDPRVKLDCEHLFLQLEQRRVQEESSEFEEQVEESDKRDFSPSEQAQTETVMVKEEARVTEPMEMKAQRVFVDMQLKRLYATGDVVEIKHSRGEIRASGGNPILLVADKEGLIYVRGNHIEGFSIDEAGVKSQFSTEEAVLFVLDSDSLLLAKNNKIQTAKGDISCRGLLRVRMQADEAHQSKGERDFRLNRAYRGLSYVSACEEVLVSGRQEDGTHFELKGDLLSYDARLGEFIMTGQQCDLAFAEQAMQVKGDAMARLYTDGSMKLKGADIVGTYQRPARSHEGMLQGEFQTQGEIAMAAIDGKLYCPNGMSAKDEEIDFRCTRELVVAFEREPSLAKAPAPNEAAALPDLSFTRVKGISTIHARGDIHAKGLGEFDAYVQGEVLDANLMDGTAHLQAKAAEWAEFRYQTSLLKAYSEHQASEVKLLANGDVQIEGDEIEGNMPAKDGRASLAFETQKSLYLNNAESLLVMTHPVHMQSEQGIFHSQGGVTALLRRGESATKSQVGFARHDFNFIGLEWAESPRDTAFQSAQLSLQCDGLMRVYMDETASTGQDATLAGLKSAEAHDAVRFVAKDAQGQLYRATGDHLAIDGKLGTKVLSGSRVTLNSAKKHHEATGAGAQVFVDAKNNVSLKGERQTSIVTDVVEELGRNPQGKHKKEKP